jgi:hypothetical protein
MVGQTKDPGRIMFNFETPQVKEEYERIKALGGVVIAEPYELEGGWIATLADPDGNYFQLVPNGLRLRPPNWQHRPSRYKWHFGRWYHGMDEMGAMTGKDRRVTQTILVMKKIDWRSYRKPMMESERF